MRRALRTVPVLALTTAVLAACGGEEANADPDAAASADEPTPVLAETASNTGEAATNASQEVDADLPLVRVWKSPSCSCCGDWVEHMRAAGFPVEVHDVSNLAEKKQEHGIAPQHQSCHTATVEGYVVEGHVPADLVKRMLAEQPGIEGLTVPGMPVGSPGMEVEGRKDPYDVLAMAEDGSVVVYASR